MIDVHDAHGIAWRQHRRDGDRRGVRPAAHAGGTDVCGCTAHGSEIRSRAFAPRRWPVTWSASELGRVGVAGAAMIAPSAAAGIIDFTRGNDLLAAYTQSAGMRGGAAP